MLAERHCASGDEGHRPPASYGRSGLACLTVLLAAPCAATSITITQRCDAPRAVAVPARSSPLSRVVALGDMILIPPHRMAPARHSSQHHH